MKQKLLICLFSILSLIGIFIWQNFKFYDGNLHIIFCDVGQGDAIFIRSPQGADILIDGGPDESVLGCLENNMPFWDRDIELIFATHPDSDHIAGLESVLKTYTVKSFNTSKKSSETQVFKRIQDLIKNKNIPLRFVYANDTFTLSDGLVVEHVWPTKEFVLQDASGNMDTNSFSLVQIISFGNFKTLLTGDIEYQILNTLFPSSLNIDIFKLPHHGSKTGVDDATFSLITAKLGIISAGKNNRYNHPHPSVLDFLKKYNLPYKMTSRDGEVRIVSDGDRLIFNK
jgi:competence protein ComEC